VSLSVGEDETDFVKLLDCVREEEVNRKKDSLVSLGPENEVVERD